MLRLLSLGAVLALLFAVSPAAADQPAIVWKPDLVHSRAEFTVAHMVLSQVWGHFPITQMTLETTGTSLVPTKVEATMDVARLDTDNHDRDQDLRSETYFNTARYPTITFKSTKIKPLDRDDFLLTGDLTVKNITKAETFPVHIIGKIPDSGGTRVGYQGELKVDRRDFGITDSRLMSGVLFVGYEVKIGVTAEAWSALPFTK